MGLRHSSSGPSVTCAGRGHEADTCMTYRAPGLLFWYSGLYPPLTVTDTRSNMAVAIALISPEYPPASVLDQVSVPLIIRYLKGSISKGLTTWGDDYDDTPNLIIYLNITK